ncbi:hypothetical protein CMU93_17710 [Elizabethkingia anophelis]|nr:hypothetical protein [Elizabethkingia anophelis]
MNKTILLFVFFLPISFFAQKKDSLEKVVNIDEVVIEKSTSDTDFSKYVATMKNSRLEFTTNTYRIVAQIFDSNTNALQKEIVGTVSTTGRQNVTTTNLKTTVGSSDSQEGIKEITEAIQSSLAITKNQWKIGFYNFIAKNMLCKNMGNNIWYFDMSKTAARKKYKLPTGTKYNLVIQLNNVGQIFTIKGESIVPNGNLADYKIETNFKTNDREIVFSNSKIFIYYHNNTTLILDIAIDE